MPSSPPHFSPADTSRPLRNQGKSPPRPAPTPCPPAASNLSVPPRPLSTRREVPPPLSPPPAPQAAVPARAPTTSTPRRQPIKPTPLPPPNAMPSLVSSHSGPLRGKPQWPATSCPGRKPHRRVPSSLPPATRPSPGRTPAPATSFPTPRHPASPALPTRPSTILSHHLCSYLISLKLVLHHLSGKDGKKGEKKIHFFPKNFPFPLQRITNNYCSVI